MSRTTDSEAITQQPQAKPASGPAPARWVGWVGAGIGVAVLIAGGLVTLYVQRELGAAPPAAKAPAAREPGVRRVAEDTLEVPKDVLWSLGVHAEKAKKADRPRPLPALTGCLAIDNNRLARVRSLFAGEVVALGTTDGRETDAPMAGESLVPLKVGDKVSKGQLLAVVWSKDLGEKKSELVNALSQLRADRESLNRLKSLSEGVVAQKTIRELERTVEGDEVAVDKAEATLRSWRVDDEEIKALYAEAEKLRQAGARRTAADARRWARVEVRSRIDGTILEKNVTIGDVVDTATDLFKVADLSRLTVWAQVYEDDLPALLALPRPIPWEIGLPSNPDFKTTGTLERINEIIDPVMHTALASGSVDNGGEGKARLKVGQFITATVALPAADDEVEIPTTALVEDGRESVVFVQPDPKVNRFVRRHVAVTRRYHDVVYVRGGQSGPPLPAGAQPVRPDELVVAGGAVQLKEALGELPVEEGAGSPPKETTAAGRRD